MATAMAFSKASLVRICRGRMPSSSSRTTARPDSTASPSRRASTAGGDAEPGSAMPSASDADAMVLAVNIPAQLPTVGQALRSMSPKLLVGELARCSGPDRLEHADHVEGLTMRSGARQDGPAVEEDGRQVEAGGGHQHPGQRLVAPGEGDHGVEALGVHHDFDGVGDHLPAHQRRPHAFVAHRDPVGDGDGHELDRIAARLPDAFLGPLGQPVEGHVARRDLVPRRGHPHLGFAASRHRSCRWPAAWREQAPARIRP